MKIALLGPPGRNDTIIRFLESEGHTVVCTQARLGLDWLQSEGIEFLISGGYGPVLREPILSAYPGRIINLHNSFLPWGKGVYPVLWALLEGAPTGITIHHIDAGIDSGPVLARREVAPCPDDTLKSFHDRLLDDLMSLFLEIGSDILAGRIDATPQALLGPAQPYRNRLDTERVADLLPLGWDTPVSVAVAIGRDLMETRAFWTAYEGA